MLLISASENGQGGDSTQVAPSISGKLRRRGDAKLGFCDLKYGEIWCNGYPHFGSTKKTQQTFGTNWKTSCREFSLNFIPKTSRNCLKNKVTWFSLCFPGFATCF